MNAVIYDFLPIFFLIALGAILVHWTALVTAICGAVLVRIMKGPAYVADAYPLSDADSPPRTSPKL